MRRPRYVSPDEKSVASLVVDLVVGIVLSVLAIVFALQGETAKVVLTVGLLAIDVLSDIRTEVRASRRLAEQRRNLKWEWSA